MITGYNTEIKHRGRLFHVQTEDKGVGNPVIESLIYIGGEILDSVRSSYREKLSKDFDRTMVMKLMEEQHNNVLLTIRDGKYDPASADGASTGPVGEEFITKETTLDEVVLSLIAKQASGTPPPPLEKLQLELLHGIRPTPGGKISLELCARTDASGKAVVGAKITIRLVSRSEKPATLFSGTTDDDGLVAATVQIPDRKFDAGTLVIQASSDLGVDEIRRPLV